MVIPTVFIATSTSTTKPISQTLRPDYYTSTNCNIHLSLRSLGGYGNRVEIVLKYVTSCPVTNTFFFPSSPNPSSESVPAPVTWPAFTEQNQEYLVIALKPKVKRRYKAKRMAFWNEILPKVAEFTKGITNNKIGDMQTRGQHRRWD